jgi:hypothetical protein
MPCGSCKNRRFGGIIAFFIRVTRIDELGTTLALQRASVASSPILVTLMKKALNSSETSVLTRARLLNIPEDTILHGHRSENLNSYKSVPRNVVDTVPSSSIFTYSLYTKLLRTIRLWLWPRSVGKCTPLKCFLLIIP